jgi:hypothetical protein
LLMSAIEFLLSEQASETHLDGCVLYVIPRSKLHLRHHGGLDPLRPAMQVDLGGLGGQLI